MQDYVVNRPGVGAMEQILEKNFDNAAGAILRLAWQAGLLRDEIQHLTWAQIDFLDSCIVLPDRRVPIPEDLASYLADLREGRNRCSEVVVLSDRDKKPLTPQSISRLARQALDGAGQTSVRLIDLRHDFVLCQLESHDWQYVSRITGIEAAAMNLHFGAHLEKKKVSTRVRREAAPAEIDEFALWKLLQAERTTPVGAALWLTWQLGLRLDCAIRVGGENEVVAWLRRKRSITRNETASLLGVSRSTAYNRLKLMVKRGRLTQIGARYYLKETVVPPEQQEAVILEYLDREGFAFRQDIARLLKIDARQVRPILQKMISAGQIVQEKQKYLLAEQKAHA